MTTRPPAAFVTCRHGEWSLVLYRVTLNRPIGYWSSRSSILDGHPDPLDLSGNPTPTELEIGDLNGRLLHRCTLEAVS